MPSFKERILQTLDGADSNVLTRDHAPWLLSDIQSTVWYMKFGQMKCSVCWEIEFGNSVLTAKEYAPLLRTFRYWLLVQTHGIVSDRRPAVGQVAYNRVTQVLRLLDYMLLREDKWELSKFGFRAACANDFLNMLFAFEKYSSDETSVYEWDKRLSSYLASKASELTDEQFELATLQISSLCVIDLPQEEWSLSLTREQLVRGRAYLWINGFYKKEKRLGYEYSPRTVSLAGAIYRNTLWGKSNKSIHEELCIGRFEFYIREFEGLDVRTAVGEEASERSFDVHRKILASLTLLSKFDCDVPVLAIEEAIAACNSSSESFRPPGRFRPPSFWQVMDTIRLGTDFALSYGDDLVTSYHNVLSAAAAANTTVAKFVLKNDVRDFLVDSIADLGVKVWAIRTHIGLPLGYPPPKGQVSARINSSQYFSRLRRNEGVIDLLEVLCGSIQHNVGALTARRQSELRQLPAFGALDAERRFLLFGNAKSGWGGLRAHEARPIPQLVSELIAILERLHSGMPSSEHATAYLFSLPGERGKLVHHISAYNSALDSVCDYFETPLDNQLRRNYIRQHQLRKFFVIAFMYGSSNSSLDTLRWFLGHTDAEYLWNYITMQIPGEMLRSVQATFLVEELTGRANASRPTPTFEISQSNRQALESLIFERFGTKSFKVIDAAALENYVAVLLKRGLRVAPIFYEYGGGRKYVMGVTIERDAAL